MERMTKAATVTATTELGEFTAIAAAYSVDRVGDQIVKGAFEASIGRWQKSGKRVPLHWDHKGDAHNIIGSIDPATMQEVDDGLQVSGKVDINESDTAKEAWRSMKNGTMSLSFGYMVTKAHERKDGVIELREIDLFEVSIVPVPANPDTRILSLKSADALEAELQNVKSQLATALAELEAMKSKANADTQEPAEARSDSLNKDAHLALAMEIRSGGLSVLPPTKATHEEPKPLPEFDPDELRRYSRDLMLQALSGIERTP